MSFYIYDSKGYVGDLASNKGLNDLAIYIRKHPDTEELEKLFEEGSILKTDHLMKELSWLGTPKNQDIADTLSNLISLIEKAEDVIIITQNAEMGKGDRMLQEPKCYTRGCKFFTGIKQDDGNEETERVVCKAFPDGIPDEIAYGDNLHDKPLPEQENNFVFSQ
jgi:hypothetical protein